MKIFTTTGSPEIDTCNSMDIDAFNQVKRLHDSIEEVIFTSCPAIVITDTEGETFAYMYGTEGGISPIDYCDAEDWPYAPFTEARIV